MSEPEKSGPTTAPGGAASAPSMKTVEAWFEAKKTPAHLRASSRAANRWAVGRELTEEQFDAGIATTLAVASK